MKKRIILPLAVTAGIAIAVMVYHIGFAETKAQQKPDDLYKELELFSDAVSIIRSDYVEEKKSKDLIYGALKGMLAVEQLSSAGAAAIVIAAGIVLSFCGSISILAILSK